MTPKEKAKELVEGFAKSIPGIPYGVLLEREWESAKTCALICVDEIIAAVPCEPYDGNYWEILSDRTDSVNKYWQQVKEEIKRFS